MRYLVLILLMSLSGCLCTGCRMIWTDDLFAVGILTDVVAEGAELHSDPNNLDITVVGARSETDDVTVITAGVVVGTD